MVLFHILWNDGSRGKKRPQKKTSSNILFGKVILQWEIGGYISQQTHLLWEISNLAEYCDIHNHLQQVISFSCEAGCRNFFLERKYTVLKGEWRRKYKHNLKCEWIPLILPLKFQAQGGDGVLQRIKRIIYDAKSTVGVSKIQCTYNAMFIKCKIDGSSWWAEWIKNYINVFIYLFIYFKVLFDPIVLDGGTTF